jgi:hypothetical protein
MKPFYSAPLLFLLFLGLHLSQAQRLVQATSLGQRSAAQLSQEIGVPVPNGVFLYKIQYETPDLQGVTDTASGLLVIPDMNLGAFPLLCYQHGTVGEKQAVPSNLQSEAPIAFFWGAMGYVTAAPDYLGLGDSRGFHPYVHAASEASAAIDMLYAVRDFVPSLSLSLSDQLFITGYSQGGHAALALQREIQENFGQDFSITASAPMSGPYSISGEMKRNLFRNDPYFYPAYLPYTLLSYQTVYGNIFNSLNEMFKPGYDSLAQAFYTGAISSGQLNNQLISRLTQEFGSSIPRLMFEDSVIQAVQNDPNHPFNVAMRLNDVYEWVPQAPTRLYYCKADDQVFYTNSTFTDSAMRAQGASLVSAENAGDSLDHVACAPVAVFRALFFFNGFLPVNNLSLPQTSLRVQYDAQAHGLRLQDLPPQPEAVSLQIHDLQGREIWSSPAQASFLPLPHWPRGLYLLRIRSNGKIAGQMISVSP